MTSAAIGEELPLTEVLREARRRHRISQWDLSLELGVSQRHVSFVELGRARPSRALLLRWLECLQAPLAVRNQALLAAGHAPAFDESPLGSRELRQEREALRDLLVAHEPHPALLLDRGWNVVAANAGVAWLFDAAGVCVELPGPDPADDSGSPSPPVNLLDLALGELGAAVVNVTEVAASLLEQLRDEALTEPSLRARVEQVAQIAAQAPGGSRPAGPAGPASPRYPPSLVTRYRTRHGELAFLSMFTTFGTPHSVTLASLRVELFLPVDDVTRAALGR